MIIDHLTPGLVMILGAFFVPFLSHHLRQIFMLLVIAASAASLTAGAGVHLTVPIFGQELVLYRADTLTLPFAIVFHFAAALNVFYGWHERRGIEHCTGLAYAGAAIAAVHAGDLLTLFIFWEATAVTSVFLILARRTPSASRAAVRYLLVQVTSGVLLLAGAAFYWQQTGGWSFDLMALDSLATVLIFLAFGIKAAFPLLNGWMQDAYPEASVIGAVMLSAFTTKLAIYAFARGFAGTNELIWIGAAMAIIPIFFAVMENDLRRVLAFSLNNQLGFMLVAIGIGSELAINGAVAHAFAHVIYKSLLFMSMGAVLYRVGSAKVTDLGGLYKSMPATMVFCVIGALSIAAAPLFSGYVAKTPITAALGYEGQVAVYLILLAASAGAINYAGVKVVYSAFFSRDAGLKPIEAPITMLIAMGLASAACIGIGIMPQLFYQILPYSLDYQPYDASHIIGQLELLVFAGLGFVFLLHFGLYPKPKALVLLNSDWFYRRLAPLLLRPMVVGGLQLGASAANLKLKFGQSLANAAQKLSSHPIAGPVIPGPASVVQVILLGLILGIVYAVLA